MRVLAIFLALVLVYTYANAQATTAQLARCASITIPAMRLLCYDRLSKAPADTARVAGSHREPPAGARMIEGWAMSVDTDPITDQKGVSFLLQAEGANQIDTPSLAIRCKRGELDVFVVPDQYLGSGNNRLTIRFGTEPPQQQRWSESSNHTALFYPGGRDKIEAFVRSLVGYDRLAIQVQPYEKAPMAMVFDLSGIDQVNKELWAICVSEDSK